MNAARPVKAVLADALAGGKDLKANDWRLLAFYSWDTDQTQVVPARTSVAATAGQARRRLPGRPARDGDAPAPEGAGGARRQDAGAAPTCAARPRGARRCSPTRRARARQCRRARQLRRPTSSAPSPRRARRSAPRRWSPPSTPRCSGSKADTTLSRADRMQALIARVDAGADRPAEDADKPAPAPKLPEALLADVREEAARADREITDGYERQAVITAAAYLLEQAGLAGRVRRAAQGQPREEPLALLPDVGPGRATPRSAATRPRRCAGTARPTRRAKARRRGCSGARATSARWSSWRRSDEARDRSGHAAALARGRGAARRVRAAQRPLAAEGRQASCRPGARAARTAPR